MIMLAAPLFIVGVAGYLVLAWLGIVDGPKVSGWAVIAALIGAAWIIGRIVED